MTTATSPVWTNAEYHADRTAISNSGRELFRRDPQKFGLWLKGECPVEETEDMRLGTALHAALCEPDKLQVQRTIPCIAMLMSGARAGRECGATSKIGDAYCGKHKGEDQPVEPGKIALTQEQYELLQLMVAQVRKHRLASVLLDTSRANEQTFIYQDPDTGLSLKCRPDLFHPLSVPDLKSTRITADRTDVDRAWAREVRRRGYHRQLAFYRYVLRGLGLVGRDTEWRWITCSNQPPRPYVDVWRVTEFDLDLGERQILRDLHRIADRLDRDDWEQDGLDVERIVLLDDNAHREE